MFFYDATCKISTFFEDLNFLNSRIQVKETTQAWYLTKVTTCHSFMRLRPVRQINRVH